ncbi:hypothetical protein [Chitinophaga sp.]|uniref:hypothetical protein n=1 Tax=Chitinophaga sp. TaxID=1869181 RepID=UPI002F93C3E9
MKQFIIADGCIQVMLAIACIIYIPLDGQAVFPSFHLICALLAWQLCSSLIHLAERKSLPQNKYLYALQLTLLGYCICIGLALITSSYLTLSDWLISIFYYLFFCGIVTLLPALMISITFLTVRRMFIPFQQTA